MSIEARKLQILEHLADVKDEAIIQQIENLIKPSGDFWKELPESEKTIILKAIESLDKGNRVDLDTIKAKFNR